MLGLKFICQPLACGCSSVTAAAVVSTDCSEASPDVPTNKSFSCFCASLIAAASNSSSARNADNMVRNTSTEFKSIFTASWVTSRLPSRISSSSVSMTWVKSATAVKPKVPLPPLIECAARKIVLIVSRSAAPISRFSSSDSIVSRPSKLSS